MGGLVAAAMICSEIIVRCLRTTNSSSSGAVTNHLKFKSLNITFAFMIILRASYVIFLDQNYDADMEMAFNGALMAVSLVLLLATNTQARAHLGTRLRNRLASMGLEPNHVVPFLVEVRPVFI
jgi:uncharacterized MnhB-related membrane protein